MYLCYLDESGVPEIPGNSTHFVLAGIAIPIERWREADAAISAIMARYGLAEAELHAAWLLRKYLEQSHIDGLEQMDWDSRRAEASRLRVAEIHRVRKLGIAKRNSQLKKLYRHTQSYIHLTFEERRALLLEVAKTIAQWKWARLFGACIDKGYFISQQQRLGKDVNTLAFQIIVQQFAQFLDTEERSNLAKSPHEGYAEFGLLIHDNNPTVAAKHIAHIHAAHKQDEDSKTRLFTRIIETPLFVDSSLTRIVQLADLWSYALRRYIENRDDFLFQPLFQKEKGPPPRQEIAVSQSEIYHYTQQLCGCDVCT